MLEGFESAGIGPIARPLTSRRATSSFFYMAGSERRGPSRRGRLLPQPIHRQTPVWRKGVEAWTIVGQIPELEELVPPPPPTGHSSASASWITVAPDPEPIPMTFWLVPIHALAGARTK